ncbi:MAG TPA: SLC13 family permease, partial [Methylomirabilota bacterium]
MDEVNLHRLIAVVAFAGTYLGLALGRLPFLRVDRTGVAIIGGALVVVSGVLPWDWAVAAVDAHTIVLLFGMMIVAAYLRLSGFFRLATYAAVRRAHTPVGLLALIVAAAGVLSALFVNDVVCLVMAPIVLDVARQRRLPPQPYLIGLATAANVGSVATLTGNPQNMLVGSFSGIGYRTFLLREAPVALIGLAIVFAVIWLAYRRRLPAALPPVSLEERFAVHRALMTKTIAAVSVMLIAFLAGVPIALVAIAGAACCLLTRRVNPDKVYREIDWGLLVLFAGLFVVIAGVEVSGLT